MPWNTTKTRSAIIVGTIITAPLVYVTFGLIAAKLVIRISYDFICYSYKQTDAGGDVSATELRSTSIAGKGAKGSPAGVSTKVAGAGDAK